MVRVPVEPGIVVRVHDRLLILELLLSIGVEHVQFVKVDRVEGIMLCDVSKNRRISTCNFRNPGFNYFVFWVCCGSLGNTRGKSQITLHPKYKKLTSNEPDALKSIFQRF